MKLSSWNDLLNVGDVVKLVRYDAPEIMATYKHKESSNKWEAPSILLTGLFYTVLRLDSEIITLYRNDIVFHISTAKAVLEYDNTQYELFNNLTSQPFLVQSSTVPLSAPPEGYLAESMPTQRVQDKTQQEGLQELIEGTECPIAISVAEEMLRRAAVGLDKYGVTADRDDLSLLEWLTHAQEEAMDLAVYLEKIKKTIGGNK